jgi:tRNA nucleotidyltransferase (CCA-adding enzyme)
LDPRRKAALSVIRALEEAGFEAYLVGGCVRDELLGKSPQDYDVATSARPEQVESLFPRTVPTGLKHGTVTVLEKDTPVEVTTFRVEADYEDHRRPNRVEFVSSLRLDLSRRDFTINAMAMDKNGRVIDPFGGAEDLRNQCIRTVGNAEERFREDPLRMLRAARFAAQFGFSLEPDTEAAIRRLHDECRFLSVERVTAELDKMWKAGRVEPGIRVLFETGLITGLPPFRNWMFDPHPAPEKLERFDRTTDRVVRWAYLLWLCGTPSDKAGTRLRQLKMSNEDVSAIRLCFELGVNWKSWDEKEGKLLLLAKGLEPVLRGRQLAEWTSSEQGVLPSEMGWRRWWEEMPVKSMKELDVDGSDLIRHMGRPAGPWVGKVLRVLTKRAALGQIPNEKELLLKEGCHLVIDSL